MLHKERSDLSLGRAAYRFGKAHALLCQTSTNNEIRMRESIIPNFEITIEVTGLVKLSGFQGEQVESIHWIGDR